jgi:hypothetical protein
VIGTDRWRSEPPCPYPPAWPNGQTESGGRVLAVNAEARAPRGGVTRQGVVLTDLQSLRDCQQNFSLSLSLSLARSLARPLLLSLTLEVLYVQLRGGAQAVAHKAAGAELSWLAPADSDGP